MEKPFGTTVRDFIFPLALVSQGKGGLHVERVLGTAFLIGNRGYSLTASHVVVEHDPALALVGMFALDGSWVAAAVAESERHPVQDVAVLHVDARRQLHLPTGDNYTSPSLRPAGT